MRRFAITLAALAVSTIALAGHVSAAPGSTSSAPVTYTAEFGTPTGTYDTYCYNVPRWKCASSGRVPAIVTWSSSAAIKSVTLTFADDTNISGGDYTSGATYQATTNLNGSGSKVGQISYSFSWMDFCQYNQTATLSDPAGARKNQVAVPGFLLTAYFKDSKGKTVATASNNYFQTLSSTWCPATSLIPQS